MLRLLVLHSKVADRLLVCRLWLYSHANMRAYQRILALALALAAATTAVPEHPRARTLNDNAIAAANNGDLAGALALFSEAVMLGGDNST